MPLYPLLLEPIYKEKVWGGRSLERLGRTLPGGAETRIGESWELADLDATSPGDLQNFYNTYYVPNNAMLVVVGNVERAQVELKAQIVDGTIEVPTAPA